MHRLLRVSSHKPHALGQRMTRGERHGERHKGLGHGLFHIVLLAAAVEGIASGAHAKRRNEPQDKANGRQRHNGQQNAAGTARQQQKCQTSRIILDSEAKSIYGDQRRPRTGNFCQQIVFHQLTRQLLRRRFERLARQLRRRHPRHTRFRPARRRDRKPRQTPYDEGHNDLHSSTSSCVSTPERRPSAINGGSRSSVQVRSAASKVT